MTPQVPTTPEERKAILEQAKRSIESASPEATAARRRAQGRVLMQSGADPFAVFKELDAEFGTEGGDE